MNITWPAPVLRPLSAAPAALLMTFGLFCLMFSLIYIKPVEIAPSPAVKLSEVYMPEDRKVEEFEKEVTPPEPVEPTPKRPPETSMEFERDTIAYNPIKYAPQGPVVLGNPDSGPIPTVRVEANYPRLALARNIEGFVDVGYDISASGATENLQLVSAHPEGYFEAAALKAVSRWKFKPQYISGKPAPARGFVARITFKIRE